MNKQAKDYRSEYRNDRAAHVAAEAGDWYMVGCVPPVGAKYRARAAAKVRVVGTVYSVIQVAFGAGKVAALFGLVAWVAKASGAFGI
jgi:hypothetical protein